MDSERSSEHVNLGSPVAKKDRTSSGINVSPSRKSVSDKLRRFDTNTASRPSRSPLGNVSNGNLSRGSSLEPGTKIDTSMLSPSTAFKFSRDDDMNVIMTPEPEMPPLEIGGLSPVGVAGLEDTPKKSSPSLAPVNQKVKRFEAAMDKPEAGNAAMRKSKNNYHTGFFGYAVLDYRQMTKQVAEQVKVMEDNMHKLQSEYDSVKSQLQDAEDVLCLSYEREASAQDKIKEQSMEIVHLQGELAYAKVWLAKEKEKVTKVTNVLLPVSGAAHSPMRALELMGQIQLEVEAMVAVEAEAAQLEIVEMLSDATSADAPGFTTRAEHLALQQELETALNLARASILEADAGANKMLATTDAVTLEMEEQLAAMAASLSERKAECKAQEKKLAVTAHLAVELAELKASLQDKDQEMEAAKADARLQTASDAMAADAMAAQGQWQEAAAAELTLVVAGMKRQLLEATLAAGRLEGEVRQRQSAEEALEANKTTAALQVAELQADVDALTTHLATKEAQLDALQTEMRSKEEALRELAAIQVALESGLEQTQAALRPNQECGRSKGYMALRPAQAVEALKQEVVVKDGLVAALEAGHVRLLAKAPAGALGGVRLPGSLNPEETVNALVADAVTAWEMKALLEEAFNEVFSPKAQVGHLDLDTFFTPAADLGSLKKRGSVGRLDLELFATPSAELSSRGLKAGSIDMDMYATPGEWLITGTAAKKVGELDHGMYATPALASPTRLNGGKAAAALSVPEMIRRMRLEAAGKAQLQSALMAMHAELQAQGIDMMVAQRKGAVAEGEEEEELPAVKGMLQALRLHTLRAQQVKAELETLKQSAERNVQEAGEQTGSLAAALEEASARRASSEAAAALEMDSMRAELARREVAMEDIRTQMEAGEEEAREMEEELQGALDAAAEQVAETEVQLEELRAQLEDASGELAHKTAALHRQTGHAGELQAHLEAIHAELEQDLEAKKLVVAELEASLEAKREELSELATMMVDKEAIHATAMSALETELESTRSSVDAALGSYNEALETLQSEHAASLTQVEGFNTAGEVYLEELNKREQVAEELRRQLAKKVEHVKVMQVKKSKAEESIGGLLSQNSKLEQHLQQQKASLLIAAQRLQTVEAELTGLRAVAEQKSMMEDALAGALSSLASPRDRSVGPMSPAAEGPAAVEKLALRANKEKAKKLAAQEEVMRFETQVSSLLLESAKNEAAAAATLAVVQAARDEVLAAQSADNNDLTPTRTIQVLSSQARAQHKMQVALDDVRGRLVKWDAAAAELTPAKTITALGERAAEAYQVSFALLEAARARTPLSSPRGPSFQDTAEDDLITPKRAIRVLQTKAAGRAEAERRLGDERRRVTELDSEIEALRLAVDWERAGVQGRLAQAAVDLEEERRNTSTQLQERDLTIAGLEELDAMACGVVAAAEAQLHDRNTQIRSMAAEVARTRKVEAVLRAVKEELGDEFGDAKAEEGGGLEEDEYGECAEPTPLKVLRELRTEAQAKSVMEEELLVALADVAELTAVSAMARSELETELVQARSELADQRDLLQAARVEADALVIEAVAAQEAHEVETLKALEESVLTMEGADELNNMALGEHVAAQAMVERHATALEGEVAQLRIVLEAAEAVQAAAVAEHEVAVESLEAKVSGLEAALEALHVQMGVKQEMLNAETAVNEELAAELTAKEEELAFQTKASDVEVSQLRAEMEAMEVELKAQTDEDAAETLTSIYRKADSLDQARAEAAAAKEAVEQADMQLRQVGAQLAARTVQFSELVHLTAAAYRKVKSVRSEQDLPEAHVGSPSANITDLADAAQVQEGGFLESEMKPEETLAELQNLAVKGAEMEASLEAVRVQLMLHLPDLENTEGPGEVIAVLVRGVAEKAHLEHSLLQARAELLANGQEEDDGEEGEEISMEATVAALRKEAALAAILRTTVRTANWSDEEAMLPAGDCGCTTPPAKRQAARGADDDAVLEWIGRKAAKSVAKMVDSEADAAVNGPNAHKARKQLFGSLEFSASLLEEAEELSEIGEESYEEATGTSMPSMSPNPLFSRRKAERIPVSAADGLDPDMEASKDETSSLLSSLSRGVANPEGLRCSSLLLHRALTAMTPEQDNTEVSSPQKLKATLLESHATIDFLKGELADAQAIEADLEEACRQLVALNKRTAAKDPSGSLAAAKAILVEKIAEVAALQARVANRTEVPAVRTALTEAAQRLMELTAELEAKREVEKELGDILAQVVEREAAIAALRDNAGADGELATPAQLAELEELRQKLAEHETMMVDINEELQSKSEVERRLKAAHNELYAQDEVLDEAINALGFSSPVLMSAFTNSPAEEEGSSPGGARRSGARSSTPVRSGPTTSKLGAAMHTALSTQTAMPKMTTPRARTRRPSESSETGFMSAASKLSLGSAMSTPGDLPKTSMGSADFVLTNFTFPVAGSPSGSRGTSSVKTAASAGSPAFSDYMDSHLFTPAPVAAAPKVALKSDFVASLMALRVDVTRHSRQLTRLRRAVTVDVAAKNETVATLQRELKAMCALLREREAASAETVAGDSRLAAALAPALAELTALRGTVEGLQQEVYSKAVLEAKLERARTDLTKQEHHLAVLKVEVQAEKAALVATCLELGEREKEVANLRVAADDCSVLRQALDAAKRDLNEREKRLQQMQDEVQLAETRAAQLEKEATPSKGKKLESLEAELGAVHEQLLEREATMAAFRKEAGTKVALVRELEMAMDSALDTAKSEAVEFEASLSKTQRDAEVKRGLREHIHEQDATIGHLRMQNAHKQGVESALEYVRGELDVQQGTIGGLRAELEGRLQDLERVAADLTEKGERVESLQFEVEALRRATIVKEDQLAASEEQTTASQARLCQLETALRVRDEMLIKQDVLVKEHAAMVMQLEEALFALEVEAKAAALCALEAKAASGADLAGALAKVVKLEAKVKLLKAEAAQYGTFEQDVQRQLEEVQASLLVAETTLEIEEQVLTSRRHQATERMNSPRSSTAPPAAPAPDGAYTHRSQQSTTSPAQGDLTPRSMNLSEGQLTPRDMGAWGLNNMATARTNASDGNTAAEKPKKRGFFSWRGKQ